MQCSECKKRPATLQLMQIINGKKTEVPVCEVCAKKIGYINHSEDAYSLHDLLSGLFNVNKSQLELQNKSFFDQVEDVSCPRCNMTFTEFQRIGKFGCADCYETFKAKLDVIFRRVHSGNTRHHGKIPKRKGTSLNRKKRIRELREELKTLIDTEEFEKAAIIRDEIKHVENKKLGDDS